MIKHHIITFIFFVSASETGEHSILGTPSTIYDPLWYPYSGTFHHITYDSNNFTAKMTYSCQDHVKIGKTASIKISPIGNVNCTTSHTNIVLCLNNLLHVPTITKNLINVFQLAKDNNVFLNFILITILLNIKFLLRRILKEGLYVFPSFVSPLYLLFFILLLLFYLLNLNYDIPI